VLFLFSFVYAVLLYHIKPNGTTSQLAWTYAVLFSATAINAILRSRANWYDVGTLIIWQRTAMLMAAMNAPVVVISLARSYNGAISWSREWQNMWDKLRRAE